MPYTSTALFVIATVLATVIANHAHADAVFPAPKSCPVGSTLEPDCHQGPICIVAVCSTTADCKDGQTCEELTFCLRGTFCSGGFDDPESQADEVLSTCDENNPCNLDASCDPVRACVSPAKISECDCSVPGAPVDDSPTWLLALTALAAAGLRRHLVARGRR